MITTIIGIGLIGGSMAISLKESGFADHIIGVDASRDSLDKALRRRIIDEDCELDEGIAKADLVILATPVDVALALLPQILPQGENPSRDGCWLDEAATAPASRYVAQPSPIRGHAPNGRHGTQRH